MSMSTFTIKGSQYQTQLTVLDFRNTTTPRDEIKFAVYWLPASAKKYTSFKMTGKKAYYGDDFDAAIAMLERISGKENVAAQLPAKVAKKYKR